MANEIAFIEKFVFAENRETVLQELIPGTEDHFFYHALHQQNSGQREAFAATLRQWAERYPESARRKILENRHALLNYEHDPRATLDYLKRELNLNFDHQQDRRQDNPNLPTKLDPASITHAAFVERALQDRDSLKKVTDRGLEALVASGKKLTAPQLRDLLGRVSRPDFPQLLDLIVTEMASRESRGFGGFPIHSQLLPGQLDELAERRKELRESPEFVNTYLRKLAPSEDTHVMPEPEERKAYLDRVWAYVKRLSPAFNSLKAHVLYQILDHERGQGRYDQALLLEYLKLPRGCSYINPRYLEKRTQREAAADLNADFQAATKLPPIGNDEPLVRDYLLHRLREAESYKPYVEFVREDWLKPIFAEAKIVNGVGDQQRWFSLLDPETYKALLARVDLDFAPENKAKFSVDEEVKLTLDVKNVENLLVKIYEINALNYYQQVGREVNTDLNLDGLVPNEEQAHQYGEAPLRRVRRSFSFPSLKDKRGIWVIEFIGNGKSSRALVRKGQLQFLSRSTINGESVFVLDERNEIVKNAAVWFAGRKFSADDKGAISIPFSNDPGEKAIVLTDATGFASLERLTLPQENYQLSVGFFVNREQLLPNRKATLLVRPTLTVNNLPTTLSVLEDVRLSITATDLDGIVTTDEIKDFKLSEGEEATHELRVPDRLASLTFALSAKVDVVSTGQEQALNASQTYQLNGIEKSAQTADLHLSWLGGEWSLELLGKSGEPVKNRAVLVEVRHQDFTDDFNVNLQTNEQGRIALGALPEIERIKASLDSQEAKRWALPKDRLRVPANIHAALGEIILVPYVGTMTEVAPGGFSLLEMRGGTFVANHLAKAKLLDGFLRVEGLPAGDHELIMKEMGMSVALRVAEGAVAANVVLGKNRHLTRGPALPMQITSITPAAEEVAIQLVNASQFTRVHVLASRFLPAFNPFDALSFPAQEPYQISPARRINAYVSGRNIGDEYRYVIDRRGGKKFPGNLLTRPGLLLNPWELRSTETVIDQAKSGEMFGASATGLASQLRREAQAKQDAAPTGPGDFASLDFLATDGVLLVNLKPDEDGRLRIKRKDLGDRQHLLIYATDPEEAVLRQLSLPDASTKFADISLAHAIDSAGHFAEQRAGEVLRSNESLTIQDARAARVEVYDSLAKVYRYFATRGQNPTLAEFGFILQWPKLKEAEKRAKYSQYACHELSFFLSRKDPEFFRAVIQPYLANKKDKTFLDHYLLGEDLHRYLEPWRFARLNIAERAFLAKHLGGEDGASIQRDLKDMYDLVPPNPEQTEQEFQTALGGLGLGKEGRELEELQALRELDINAPAEAADAPVTEASRALPPTSASPGAKPRAQLRGAMLEKEIVEEKLAELSDAASKDTVLALGRMDEKRSKNAQALLGEEADDDKKAFFFKRKAGNQPFYRKLDSTKEWAENNYYKLPIAEQSPTLISLNGFWLDYATWNGQGAFLTPRFTEATRNFAEMMLALSVLDLPFEAGKHGSEVKEGGFTLKAASDLIAFRREVRAAPRAPQESALLVSQNFFRNGDRYQQVENEQLDKFVTQEFLTGVVYGCEVVVTNPTSTRVKAEVLTQIPANSIPVLGTKATRGVHLRLEPYSTRKFDFYFYFPKAGKYRHYPVHVARQGQTIGEAAPFEFNAVDQLSKLDTQSWEYVSQWGDEAEVIRFLEQNNLHNLNLDRIAWRLRKLDFFQRVRALVESRRTYHPTLYSYAVLHGEEPALRQFLLHQDNFLAASGSSLTSALITIDPIERYSYEHLEYSPLVNARVHALGGQRKILNNAFHQQYHRLLDVLQYRPNLAAMDRLSLVYYLFLQDRVDEALTQLAKIEGSQLPTQIQWDYLKAYAAFYQADVSSARAIANKYANYPVDRWRERFAAVASQIDEIEGKGPEVTTAKDREQTQDQLAAKEPQFDFAIESGAVKLNHRNLSEVLINYYAMDVELLFSSNPFVSQDSARFSIIRPNFSETRKLEAGQNSLSIPLPREFAGKNLLVEIIGAGQKKALAHYSNSMNMQIAQNYGRLDLKHASDQRPLPKVYVKVYARMKDGQVSFYKDGYTDLRGKFDYTSLNTNEIENVDRFSLLVLSETDGAVVREVAPPQR